MHDILMGYMIVVCDILSSYTRKVMFLLACLIGQVRKGLILQEILVVRDFLDVFPNDLLAYQQKKKS